MKIVIKEQLNLNDFLKANFPHPLKPFYANRLFIINISFAVLFGISTIYLYFISFQKDIQFEAAHYIYLLMSLVFAFLSFFLVYQEKKKYKNIIEQINGLETNYIITPKNIIVKNKKVHITYNTKDLTKFTDLPKWLVFEFKNGEKVSIYKPNVSTTDLNQLIKIFK